MHTVVGFCSLFINVSIESRFFLFFLFLKLSNYITSHQIHSEEQKPVLYVCKKNYTFFTSEKVTLADNQLNGYCLKQVSIFPTLICKLRVLFEASVVLLMQQNIPMQKTLRTKDWLGYQISTFQTEPDVSIREYLHNSARQTIHGPS